MKDIARLHRKIAPELISVMEDRYNILRHIQYAQPVGWRALAAMLGVGERIVRAQVDFLKNAGLVDFSPLGMTVTDEGGALLSELAAYIRLVRGLTDLEEELAVKLRLERVVIIPGDSQADAAVQRELGRAAAGVLSQYLGDNMTIAVSGGSTMATLADAVQFSAPGTTVVPARGGLGEQVEYQANTIAARIAGKLGGRYRLLHIPDGLSEEALEAILASDGNVRAVADMIKRAHILVHGIGQAAQMAARRGLPAETIREITARGAVGEALGQYCTITGDVVYVTNSVGLRLADLTGIGRVIAVAGGSSKAAAIVAVTGAGGQDILITDEAAARAIQGIINS
ncbi:transcriptional regulator, DeoR family [Thermosinus carboxydivorans Nor1]|uniref:Transcriptional regulator, DeoR family n=1 Tax=Thermosinus carboxydivorans Nor1 TaxID=401526 RepID=A1HSR4_9FIRM|nr:sugar-binding domain-containing protein [Thermosinus carboxydivorans]EAX46945.1 transcriptional regulator, DeoR family [Thermosinus carboxydivorans Nor1]